MKANWKNDGFHKYSDEYGSVVPDCSERWTLQPAGGIIHQLRGGHLIRAKKEGKKERKRGGEELRGWRGEKQRYSTSGGVGERERETFFEALMVP